MNISGKFGALARGILTATAVTAAASMVPAAANAWTVGWQGGGGDDFSYIELDDENGNSYQVRIASKNTSQFKTDAIRVMKDYVSWKNLESLSDADAAGFLFVTRILADDTNLAEADFRREIGLDMTTYEGLAYKRDRYNVLVKRAYILNPVQETNIWYANQDLEYNDAHLQEANDALAAAKQKYPHETAFQKAPLTVEDLRNIRRNVAWLNVQFAIDLFNRIDSGRSNPQMLGRDDTNQLFQTVKVLYRDIQIDPSQATYGGDITAGNRYNREIPVFMADYIRAEGMTPEDFYKRLIDLRNYYDRTYHIDPKPPAVPAFAGQSQQPVPEP